MASRFGVKDAAASELLKELSSRGMVERTSDGWRATSAGAAKLSTPTPVTPERGELSTKEPKLPKVMEWGGFGGFGFRKEPRDECRAVATGS